MAVKKTINAIWSDLTTNRVDFSEKEIESGILYKGPIVSNQLNGVVYNIYSMLDFMQRTGALYNSNKIYFNNNIVSVITKRQGEPLRLEYFVCLTNEQNGIKNIPPLINSAYDENADIPIFQGGATDNTHWARVDAVGAGNIYQTRDTFDISKKIKLITIPEILQQAEFSREIKAELNFIAVFEGKTTSFTLELRGLFVKDALGNVQVLPNRLGIPLPEIYYKNVYSEVVDFGEAKNFYDMKPYGLSLEYGWEGDPQSKQWAIYISLRQGITSLHVEGEATLCNVSLNLDSEQTTTDNTNASLDNITIPIRSGGAFEAWENIGQIVADCASIENNPALQYQKGYFILNNSSDENISGISQKLNYPNYGMFCKIKGISNGGDGVAPPALAGMFLRNLGEHKLPNAPATQRQAGTIQTDAQRRLQGGLGCGAGGAGLFEWYTGLFEPTNFNNTNKKKMAGSGSNFDGWLHMGFDSAKQTPTAFETRPNNLAEQFYLRAF